MEIARILKAMLEKNTGKYFKIRTNEDDEEDRWFSIKISQFGKLRAMAEEIIDTICRLLTGDSKSKAILIWRNSCGVASNADSPREANFFWDTTNLLVGLKVATTLMRIMRRGANKWRNGKINTFSQKCKSWIFCWSLSLEKLLKIGIPKKHGMKNPTASMYRHAALVYTVPLILNKINPEIKE